jgi:chromosome segregation ATPase
MITTREKLMFSKLNSFIKQYEEEIKKFKELERIEAKLIELLERFDKEKEACFNEMFTIFEKEFDRIFKFITNNGTTDVRLKRIADKARGFVKYKHSISIDVSFSGRD